MANRENIQGSRPASNSRLSENVIIDGVHYYPILPRPARAAADLEADGQDGFHGSSPNLRPTLALRLSQNPFAYDVATIPVPELQHIAAHISGPATVDMYQSGVPLQELLPLDPTNRGLRVSRHDQSNASTRIVDPAHSATQFGESQETRVTPSEQADIQPSQLGNRTAGLAAGAMDDWLKFDILRSDAGEYSPEYGVRNMLFDDQSVYCSLKEHHCNFLLGRGSANFSIPFTLNSVAIKIPISGYTSPLRSGFLFVLTEPLEFEEMKLFDSMEPELATSQSPIPLPALGPSVKTVLYFHLDRNAEVFSYRFKRPITGSYIILKFLSAHDRADNIDLQFIGFRGREGPRQFASGQLC